MLKDTSPARATRGTAVIAALAAAWTVLLGLAPAGLGPPGLAEASPLPATPGTNAPSCQDSWRSPNGGNWSSASAWSTGSPPTAAQDACITRSVRGPVVLSGTVSVRSLTVGGAGRGAELELANGAELTLGATSTVTPTGELLVSGVTAKVQVRAPAVLINDGKMDIRYEGLQLQGDLVNAPGGTVLLEGTAGWAEASDAGELDLMGASRFTNHGAVWAQDGGGIQAPYGGGTGAVLDNAGGFIANAGNITVSSGGTFVEGAGQVLGSADGNYNRVEVDGGTLDLAGPGASTFQVTGATRLAGTVAPAQAVVTFSTTALTTAGTLVNRGVIATGYATTTLTVPAGATFYNQGTVAAVHGNTFNVGGDMVNQADGTIDVAGGTFGLVGRADVVNRGTVSVTGTGSVVVPNSGSAPAVFSNAGGTLVNQGTFQVQNGTFIEGAGTETGSPVRLQADGTLDLRGTAASRFEFIGGHLEGDIAPAQSVTFTGTVSVPAHFTNSGQMTARGTVITLPPGGTLTNRGTLNSPPFTQELVLAGNLVNAAGAVMNMNGAGGYGGNLYMTRPGASFDNQGTLERANAFVDLQGLHETFDNTGTIDFGLQGGTWGSFGLHSGFQATAGYGNVVLDGVIDPVFADGTEPALPWPSSKQTITYQVLGGSGGNSGVFSLRCAATVGGHWDLSCPTVRRPGGKGAQSGQAILTATSTTTLSPTLTTLASTEPRAGYGRAYTSHYGQPVTFTATVVPEHGARPTGTVTFYDVTGVAEDVTVLGTVRLASAAGVATAKLTTRALGVGEHDVVAFYNGDGADLPGTSKDYTQEIAPDATTVGLALGPEPVFGHAATLRATVKPARYGPQPPTGDVVFLGQGGGQYLGSVAVKSTPAGVSALLRTTAVLPGSDNVVAVYAGDANYVSGISPTVDYVSSAPPP